MDSVVPRVQVGVQECVASSEHLCVGAVHVPAVGSGWICGYGYLGCACVHQVLQCRVSSDCVSESVPF